MFSIRRLPVLPVVVILSASAASATVVLPRYQLPVGKKLFYSTESESKSVQSTRGSTYHTEVWVVSLNQNTSVRILLQRTSVSFRVDAQGRREEGKPETDRAWCDLFPAAGPIQDYSREHIDAAAMFPLLPPDTFAARTGWDHLSPGNGDYALYKTDNKSLDDSIWLIDATYRTALDEVYGISSHARLQFDTRYGYFVQQETQSTSGSGATTRTSTSRTVLDSVRTFDPGDARPLLAELTGFFAAESAYDALCTQAEELGGAGHPMLVSAENLLEAVRVQATEPPVVAMFDAKLDGHARLVADLEQQWAWRAGIVGKPARNWKLTGLDGKTYRLEDFRGKVVLLDFWYRNCPWCIRAMPQLKALAVQFSGRPVAVLGMNTDKDTADADFVVDKLKLNYLTLLARGVDKQYGVTGYPTLFIIDRKGFVRDIHIGYSRDLGQKLTRIIEPLLTQE